MCRSISLKGVRGRRAGPVARGAPDPRVRGASRASTRTRSRSPPRRRGADPHLGAPRPSRICPFPGELRIVQPSRSRDGRRPRRADRRAVRGGQPPARRPLLKGRRFLRRAAAARSPSRCSARRLAPVGRSAAGSRSASRRREQKTLFGFGGEATVYVWGRRALDPRAAGPAARPTSRSTCSRRRRSACSAPPPGRRCPICRRRSPIMRLIDLKPFAAKARSRTSARQPRRVPHRPSRACGSTRPITGLRLVDLAYDAKTLRIVAEVERHRQRGGEQPAGAVMRAAIVANGRRVSATPDRSLWGGWH